MTDYVSCPRCQGKGLVPLEDVTREQVHANVEYTERQQRQREREQEMVANRAAEMRQASADRQRKLEALMLTGSRTERAPQEVDELNERLARLQQDE